MAEQLIPLVNLEVLVDFMPAFLEVMQGKDDLLPGMP